MIIKTTDVWTEQYPNHYDCFNGAFIDGIEKDNMPYDRYKIVLNCNCEISSNTKKVLLGINTMQLYFIKMVRWLDLQF